MADFFLDPVAQITDEVAATQLAIHDAIRDTLNATVLRTRSLAGQIQALFQNPALVPRDAAQQVVVYSDSLDGIATTAPTTASAATLNTALTVELGLNAALCGLAQSVVNNPGTITTRAQALALVSSVQAATASITATLDGLQDLFETAPGIGGVTPIGSQYFAQSQSYTDLLLLGSVLSQYLLTSSFSLAVERRYTLSEPSAPISIVLREYGDAERLGFFVDTNGLTGNEIYMLPAGREVVVYA